MASTLYQVPGSRYLVGGRPWYKVPGTKYLVPRIRYLVLSTSQLRPYLWYQVLDTKVFWKLFAESSFANITMQMHLGVLKPPYFMMLKLMLYSFASIGCLAKHGDWEDLIIHVQPAEPPMASRQVQLYPP